MLVQPWLRSRLPVKRVSTDHALPPISFLRDRQAF